MRKSREQIIPQEHDPQEVYKRELFRNLSSDIKVELSKLRTSEELWQVKEEFVEAIALSGDIESAKREAKEIPLNYHEYVSRAFASIVKSLASRDPKKAFDLIPNILDEHWIADALFGILKAVSNKWNMGKIQKLADRITKIPYAYYQIEAGLLVIEILAAIGQIEAAHKKALQEPGPANRLRAYLSIYKFSHALKDIKAARACAAECVSNPWEQRLLIAEVTSDPRDIATARKEIGNIKDVVHKGRQATHFRERALIELSKITGEAKDVQVARKAAIASGTQSLLMELARFTRNDRDIDLLRKSGKEPSERFDALAVVAEITKQESDFRAAYEAAKKLRGIPGVTSGEYLRAHSFVELAQILGGSTLHR